MAAIVTRFAPSPTGYLHLGHAHAALFAEAQARAGGGHMLLRIEDIDRSRCRAEFDTAIVEDLAWLGLGWDGAIMRQSERAGAYSAALAALDGLGVLYPCFCTRRDIAEEIARAGSAPHGPDGPLYPGTCRRLGAAERAERMAAGEAHALRIDVAKAVEIAGPLSFAERTLGEVTAEPRRFGDAVIARKDIGTSYHLAVVVDDAAQEVSLVTRGEDLLAATHLHRLLQELLGLNVPAYHHHRLIRDAAGARLAKRADSDSIRALRERGLGPAEVRALAGFGPDGETGA